MRIGKSFWIFVIGFIVGGALGISFAAVLTSKTRKNMGCPPQEF
ncbi:MAG: hypothetical protein ACYS91_20655 [Planctomycetota bacterium]|jgi:hypothetical membrane protein